MGVTSSAKISNPTFSTGKPVVLSVTIAVAGSPVYVDETDKDRCDLAAPTANTSKQTPKNTRNVFFIRLMI
ncbi:MAG: hypothetical protein B6U97_05055 [Candidatus Altiarchaeales archaeon ex4484_96]|nr:MAG: hypothetical protein B6U97_05055 [Candidatus Altiarchaeales archaeon ex4484_96]